MVIGKATGQKTEERKGTFGNWDEFFAMLSDRSFCK